MNPCLDRSPEQCVATATEWAQSMAAKLQAGAAKGKPHWLSEDTSVEALVLHFFAEVRELFDAPNDIERTREAADVANLAFMLSQRIQTSEDAQRARDAARLVRQCSHG